jgi:hypothetical protein
MYSNAPVWLPKEKPLGTAAVLASPATGAEIMKIKEKFRLISSRNRVLATMLSHWQGGGQQDDDSHQVSHSPHSSRLEQRFND